VRNVKSRKVRGLFDGATPTQRLGYVFVGLIFIAMGVLRLLEGGANFRNPWGQIVFAPFAIDIGLLLIVAVVVAWMMKK